MRFPKSKWLLGSLALAVLVAQTQAANCGYKIDNEWNTGFTGAITVANNSGSTINGWNVNWSYSRSKIVSS